MTSPSKRAEYTAADFLVLDELLTKAKSLIQDSVDEEGQRRRILDSEVKHVATKLYFLLTGKHAQAAESENKPISTPAWSKDGGQWKHRDGWTLQSVATYAGRWNLWNHGVISGPPIEITATTLSEAFVKAENIVLDKTSHNSPTWSRDGVGWRRSDGWTLKKVAPEGWVLVTPQDKPAMFMDTDEFRNKINKWIEARRPIDPQPVSQPDNWRWIDVPSKEWREVPDSLDMHRLDGWRLRARGTASDRRWQLWTPDNTEILWSVDGIREETLDTTDKWIEWYQKSVEARTIGRWTHREWNVWERDDRWQVCYVDRCWKLFTPDKRSTDWWTSEITAFSLKSHDYHADAYAKDPSITDQPHTSTWTSDFNDQATRSDGWRLAKSSNALNLWYLWEPLKDEHLVTPIAITASSMDKAIEKADCEILRLSVLASGIQPEKYGWTWGKARWQGKYAYRKSSGWSLFPDGDYFVLYDPADNKTTVRMKWLTEEALKACNEYLDKHPYVPAQKTGEWTCLNGSVYRNPAGWELRTRHDGTWSIYLPVGNSEIHTHQRDIALAIKEADEWIAELGLTVNYPPITKKGNA